MAEGVHKEQKKLEQLKAKVDMLQEELKDRSEVLGKALKEIEVLTHEKDDLLNWRQVYEDGHGLQVRILARLEMRLVCGPSLTSRHINPPPAPRPAGAYFDPAREHRPAAAAAARRSSRSRPPLRPLPAPRRSWRGRSAACKRTCGALAWRWTK